MRIRPERVAQSIRREIAEILEHRVRDPRVSGRVNVTDVTVTRDLSFARIFVSVLAGEEERARVLAALTQAAPFVRRELAPRLKLREMPEIRFEFDPSIESGARVDELLRKLREGESIDDGS